MLFGEYDVVGDDADDVKMATTTSSTAIMLMMTTTYMKILRSLGIPC